VLLAAGVVAYRDALIRAGQEGLWPQLPVAKEGGYKRNLSRWYNEKFNRRHVTKGGGKTSHSFRHTFATRMKDLKTEPLVQMELMGHAPQEETFARYADGYTPDVLAEAIQKLTYSDVDFAATIEACEQTYR